MLDRKWGLGPGRGFGFRKLDSDPDSEKFAVIMNNKKSR